SCRACSGPRQLGRDDGGRPPGRACLGRAGSLPGERLEEGVEAGSNSRMAAPSPVKRPSQAGNLSIKQSIYNRGQELLAEMYQPEASATRLQSLGFVSKLTAYLRARPIMVLALLTPGIPEYLSGSSSTTWLALNP